MHSSTSQLARGLGLAAIVFLCACAGGARWRDSPSSPTTDTPGEVVARDLTARYEDQRPDCRKDENDNPLPAVLCSGVLMRITRRGPGYEVWNPNPGSPTPHGVPFSWLRRDSGFSRAAWGLNNGFIILPYFRTDGPDENFTPLTVRCIYPFDGNTDARVGGDEDGCAEHPNFADTGPCQAQGIDTAEEWLARFGSGGMYGDQCSFTLLPGTADASAVFEAQIRIRQTVVSKFHMHNEVIVGTWGQNDPRVPVEAFFYLTGEAAGRADAQENQKAFESATGRWVPVIRVTLPANPASSADFSYDDSDQGILPDPLVFDTSPVVLGGKTFIISERHDILPPFDADNSITRVASEGKPPYTYHSSDPAVAVVSSAGEVTPRAKGDASISVSDSAGATAAYPITFTDVVQVGYVGRMTYTQALFALEDRGERLPAEDELMLLQRAFAGRWPYPDGRYLTSQGCPFHSHLTLYINVVSDSRYCVPYTQAAEVVGLR